MIETINKNKANFNMSLQLKNLAKMFGELDQAPPLYQPSKFWQKLNKIHINQLSQSGIKNFKRSVNMRYFNWGILGIVRLQLFPVIDGLKNFNLRPFLESHFINNTSPKSAREFNLVNAYIYKVFVAYLYEFVKKSDRLNIFDYVKEPQLGNPFLISYRDYKISQDLCNSVFEFYSIINHINSIKKLAIAELGAGYGRTAYVFLKQLSDCSYCIIDIPPALYISQQYLSKIFQEDKIFLFRPFTNYSKIKKEFESSRIKFLMPHQIELLPNKCFDLFINISSLHEMSLVQIKNYLNQIDRLNKQYVYTKQWLKSRTSDNNYITMNQYPIPKKWKVIYQHRHQIQNMLFEALYQLNQN